MSKKYKLAGIEKRCEKIEEVDELLSWFEENDKLFTKIFKGKEDKILVDFGSSYCNDYLKLVFDFGDDIKLIAQGNGLDKRKNKYSTKTFYGYDLECELADSDTDHFSQKIKIPLGDREDYINEYDDLLPIVDKVRELKNMIKGIGADDK